jgi:hypothetical protein
LGAALSERVFVRFKSNEYLAPGTRRNGQRWLACPSTQPNGAAGNKASAASVRSMQNRNPGNEKARAVEQRGLVNV